MKLNSDCVRDILISVEESADSYSAFRYESDQEHLLNQYSPNELLYHVKQCKMADLIVSYQDFGAGDIILISDLTPKGHEFLANIRNNNVWIKIKNIAANIGASSLSALIQIATNIATSLVDDYLRIT